MVNDHAVKASSIRALISMFQPGGEGRKGGDSDALGVLIHSLGELVNPPKEGERVSVPAGATTTNGGAVHFGREVEAEVMKGADAAGDVLVRSDDGLSQYVAYHMLRRMS
ncbi:hypothetical protein ABZ348_31225 [Streptomyces sp. NPDC005963]|uniref:hypothetical protein n=1 Tax=Streptomyces sp. NPDC005963 TaxID=3156721 RepID=UPI0033FE404C